MIDPAPTVPELELEEFLVRNEKSTPPELVLEENRRLIDDRGSVMV